MAASMQQMEIADEGASHKYFTIIPNQIDEMDLTLAEFRLYFHLKRICGTEGGKCWKTTAKLAEGCRLSINTTRQARKGLVVKKLIRAEAGNFEKGESFTISVLDIWKSNMDRFGKAEEPPTKSEAPPPPAAEAPPSKKQEYPPPKFVGNKKNHEKKNQEDISPVAKDAPDEPANTSEKKKSGKPKSKSPMLTPEQAAVHVECMRWEKATFGTNQNGGSPKRLATAVKAGFDVEMLKKIYLEQSKRGSQWWADWATAVKEYPTYKFKLDAKKKAANPSQSPLLLEIKRLEREKEERIQKGEVPCQTMKVQNL